MKPDEAIQILKTWRITGDKTHEALDMAIDALRNSPTFVSETSDLISRHEAIEAIEHITSSMSVCVNTDECHGMKRMQRQAVIELANLPSAQPEPSQVARDIATIIENEKDMRVVLQNSAQTTLYGYDIQHLAIIASILERENLSPENVGEILRDASRIYTIVRDEAVKDFNEAVRNCMEKAVKNDG